MSEAFVAAEGTLAQQMIAALESAEVAGGDLRGCQSAAVKLVPGPAESALGDQRGVEISTADHPDQYRS